mmetsp:Transcript_11797/g.27074  ORF Transcript_11797/g.27074 Transcript_11797/m.27074 type:complete len:396 (-) Transcript_11797:1196-2383(-)
MPAWVGVSPSFLDAASEAALASATLASVSSLALSSLVGCANRWLISRQTTWCSTCCARFGTRARMVRASSRSLSTTDRRPSRSERCATLARPDANTRGLRHTVSARLVSTVRRLLERPRVRRLGTAVRSSASMQSCRMAGSSRTCRNMTPLRTDAPENMVAAGSPMMQSRPPREKRWRASSWSCVMRAQTCITACTTEGGKRDPCAESKSRQTSRSTRCSRTPTESRDSASVLLALSGESSLARFPLSALALSTDLRLSECSDLSESIDFRRSPACSCLSASGSAAALSVVAVPEAASGAVAASALLGFDGESSSTSSSSPPRVRQVSVTAAWISESSASMQGAMTRSPLTPLHSLVATSSSVAASRTLSSAGNPADWIAAVRHSGPSLRSSATR